MRILVTGASGLLGLNLALEAAKEHTVFGVCNGNRIQPPPADPAQSAARSAAFTVLNVDLLAPGAVERTLDSVQPDWVIHCAALANLEACEADPQRAHQTNSELPEKLAAYVTSGGARLLHVSTDAVFDGQRGDYTEADAPNPLSVYARSKLAGEQAVLSANPAAIVGRTNLVGWSLLGKRSLSEFFFNNLQAGRYANGFTDVYFCPLLATDLAQIYLKMLGLGLSGLYHTVSSECLTKYDFAVRLARRFGFDPALVVAADASAQ